MVLFLLGSSHWCRSNDRILWWHRESLLLLGDPLRLTQRKCSSHGRRAHDQRISLLELTNEVHELVRSDLEVGRRSCFIATAVVATCSRLNLGKQTQVVAEVAGTLVSILLEVGMLEQCWSGGKELGLEPLLGKLKDVRHEL